MFEQPCSARSMPPSKDHEWPSCIRRSRWQSVHSRSSPRTQANQTPTTSLEPPPRDSPESLHVKAMTDKTAIGSLQALVVAASGKTETASLQELPDRLGLYRPLIEGAADYTDDHHPSAMVASTSLTANKSEGKMLAALAKIWDESHQFVDISCIPWSPLLTSHLLRHTNECPMVCQRTRRHPPC
jgi:hypothetical protein